MLLTDAEMSRFITDGYLILNSELPPDRHRQIDERITRVLEKEGNPGNNILPAVPEMAEVLASPRIQGALTSVLGADYVLHPHRFLHNNNPGKLVDGAPQVGAGSRSFVGWHQDDHSPLSRPRHHYLRYAMLLYYPQDTPLELGPTQIIPGTHLFRRIPEEEMSRGFQAGGSVGTCVLLHFDLAHGGSLNLGNRARYMVKFVFTRVSEPVAPGWDCRETQWRAPENHVAGHELAAVWKHHWEWHSGRDLGELSLSEGRASISALLEKLDSEVEPVSLNAIYQLARLGKVAVVPLADRLRQCQTNGWNEGAVVMEKETYALAANGGEAISVLISLLDQPNEWVQLNSLFALGEMGYRAESAVPHIVRALHHTSHPVVRTALDALGQIRMGTSIALPEIKRLLTTSIPQWKEPLKRNWTGQDQVRTNAMITLLRMGEEAGDVDELVSSALRDDCGYVGGFGVEVLLRSNRPESLRLAARYLAERRWDSSLLQGVRTF